MATAYLENVEFYRDLLSTAADKLEVEPKNAKANPISDTLEIADTTICTRIRPLTTAETENKHITGILAKGSSNAILFEPRLKFNGTPDAQKHEFALDKVYNDTYATDSIHEAVAQDLVPWVWAGGISTLFAYGQTGSGKTFTVNGITQLVIKDLLSMSETDDRELYVCCFELLGKKAYDLLDNRRVFSIMEDSFGTVQLVGIQEKSPKTETDFLELFKESAKLRTSAPTFKNDQSSRSHAVYRIRVVNKSSHDESDGELFLVDLAGSEGSSDSKNHSKELLAETRDINVSLSTLKDCIRGRTLLGIQQLQPASAPKKKIHIPWRSSKLTQVLKHVFGTQGERACKTVVIACVAPSIVDSAHSKNTLRYAELLRIPAPKLKPRDTLDPSGWSNERMKKWICENSGTPPIDAELLAQSLNGFQLCKLPKDEFLKRCLQSKGIDTNHASAFYQKLWRTRIDSRQTVLNKDVNGSAEAKTEPEAQAIVTKTPFKERISPGMFFRTIGSKWQAGKLFMVMGPARPSDFEGLGEDRQFICAAVIPGIMGDSYTLLVNEIHTWSVSHMAAEIMLEYDIPTRYYFINL